MNTIYTRILAITSIIITIAFLILPTTTSQTTKDNTKDNTKDYTIDYTIDYTFKPPSPTWSKEVPCSSDYGKPNPHDGSGGGGFVQGCHPNKCNRLVFDNFLDDEGVDRLKSIAERAIEAGRGNGGRPGPTIIDINSGYLRDDSGLVNIYSSTTQESQIFTPSDFEFYKDVISRIRTTVSFSNSLSPDMPKFTAPTFITRIKHDPSWRPSGMHDVYWMPHVDKDNTGHYDYSGLLYLSEGEVDFHQGTFNFLKNDEEQDTIEDEVKPERGKLVSFTAGSENLHRVNVVRGGTRYVLSFWFTCDENKEFENFLDGEVHRAFKQQEL